MSDNNDQQPANNQQPQEEQQPPRPRGGLLRNYQNQAPNQNNQPSPMQPGSPPPTQPQPGQFGPARVNPSHGKGPGGAGAYNPSSFAPPPGRSLQGPPPPQSQAGWGGPAPQRPQAPYPGQPGQPGGFPGGQPLANAMQQLRGFTNKMAAVAGHQVQPPAPMMERQRPPQMNQPMLPMNQAMSAGGMQVAGRDSARKRSLSIRIARQRRQRREKALGGRKIINIALVVMLVLIVLTGFGGSAYGYSFYQQQQPQMEKYANEQIPQMTRIYDRNNVLLYQVYSNDPAIGGRRVDVTYQDIPRVMQDAMTSIEDKTFWTNNGYDTTSILRAASSGLGGGSTITQQLIKNLSGNNQGTLQRKVNEAAMAIGMTQQFPKATILTMYLNTVPFGSQDYGVEIAAQDYFGLQPKCAPNQPCIPAISQLNYNQQTGNKNDYILGLARASLLAGIPNAPYTYDPTLDATHRQNALDRQAVVLNAMQSNHILVGGQPITNAMIQQAEALTAKMTFSPPSNTKLAPNFVDYVIGQMETALGNGNPNAGVPAFLTGGYNIRTTIDVRLNNYAQDAVKRHLYQPEYQKGPAEACGPIVLSADTNRYCYATGEDMPSNVKNGAVVVQDVKNGEILTMVGSADYNSTSPEVSGQFNAAVSSRQPGSTFKLFDYSTAFEMGWNPGITLADTITSFPNGAGAGTPVPPYTNDATKITGDYPGVYYPSDYGAKWWDFMESVSWATANSMNVPAMRAMQFTGQQAVKATAERLGLTFPASEAFGFPAAIGADVVSPLQMVNAYATFGNGGVRVPPQTILDIWNNYGQDFYHYDEANPPSARVVSPQVAYEMTTVLANEPARNFEFAGDSDLSFADVDPTCEQQPLCSSDQLAAKTGTTDNFTDNWTIGYTPEVAVAVWVGNDDSTKLINSIGITGAAPIFHSVMERTLGWCNDSVTTQHDPTDQYAPASIDKIACGPGGDYNFPFSGHPQMTFTNPGGLTQGIQAGLTNTGISTSSYAKLPLSGAAETDWMLDGN